MLPYYPDQYNNGLPNQPYYPNYNDLQPGAQMPPRQYAQQPPRPQVQVNVPSRTPQAYTQPPAPYQHPRAQQPFADPGSGVTPQYYNQQAYPFNQQYQQVYQPPPPVRVVVPPSPIQYNQVSQPPVPQPTSHQYHQHQQQQQQHQQHQQQHQQHRQQHQQQQQHQHQHQHQQQRQHQQLQQRQHHPAPTPPKQTQTGPNVPLSQSQSQSQTPAQPQVLQEQVNVSKHQPNNSIQTLTSKSVATATPTMPEQPPLPPSLLLSLADEYIDNARKLRERTEDYHILMSTALGCLQVALKNFKLSPLRSAQLSLKYAQLLYDETNNLDDAEIALTKSIDLCERMKFIDLKYAMQLLLAKVLFRSKPRAAVRDLESMIQDIETYRHTAWEYPFRFQAVFFALESSNHHNIHDAIQQLEKTQQTANLHSDRAVYAFAAILESLLHLRIPGPDSLSHSQQALAKARSLQLNPDVEKHPQMSVMMEFIEVMWAFNTAIDPAALDQKRTNLKDALYASIDGQGWTKDEMTWLRINSKSTRGIPTQFGGLIHEMDGKYYMALSWLDKRELESVGFLLTGTALVPQNHHTRGKAEKFISEGNKITADGIVAEKAMLSIKDERRNRQGHLLCIYFLAEIAFMRGNKGNWERAKEAVRSIESHVQKLGGDVPDEIRGLLDYLNGCIAQGTGDLNLALKCFQGQSLVLRTHSAANSMSKSQRPAVNHTLLDLQLLATMNTAFIIRLPSHPQHHLLDRLLNLLAPYFPNGTVRPDAASTGTANVHPVLSPTHSLLLATLPNTKILQTKSLLAAALNSARRISDVQVMSLCLTLMYDRFFRGGVQDAQAVKCAKAASHHVRTKLGNPLWAVMSGILEAESMELVGEASESVQDKRAAVGKLWENVPEGVKRVVEGQ